MSRRLLLALAVVTAIATTACTNDSEPAPTPDRPDEVVVDVGPRASIPTMVEGTDYRVTGTLPSQIDGGTAGYYDVGREHALAVRYAPQRSDTDRLLTVDVPDGRVRPLVEAGGRGKRSIPEATSGDGFIVWLQTDATSYDSLNWDIYSYETATRTRRRIASSVELGIDDPPWPSFSSIRPQVVGDQVYWAAVEQLTSGAPRTAVYRAPLDGAEPMTKVVDDATDVYADGRDLWFQRDGRMLAWDVSAGAEKKADTASVERPCGGFFHDGTLVQVDCGGGGALVITEASGRRTTLQGVDDPGYLNATSRWVGYSTGGQAYVYDLQRRRLMRMAGSQGTSARDFSGNRLFYLRQSAQASDPTFPMIALLPE